MSEDDLRMLEVSIMIAPEMGAAIPGTNGVRKARFRSSGSGKGKSGGHRIYYVHFPDYSTVILWAVIDKSDKSDLSKADLNSLGQQVARLKTLLDKGTIQ